MNVNSLIGIGYSYLVPSSATEVKIQPLPMCQKNKWMVEDRELGAVMCGR